MFNFLKYIFETFFIRQTTVPTIKKEIKNITHSLPWHNSRKWGKRPLNRINKIVVHQALTTSNLENINNYHITPGDQNHISKKGAPHICYHYIIERDGNIYQCNPLSALVWHCKGNNTSGVGVVVMGDFDGPSYEGKDGSPSQEQVDSLDYLIEDHILTKLPNLNLYSHADFGKENCPGNTLYKYIQEKNNNA